VAARDPLPLAARAAAFGLDFSQPARMVVIRSQDGVRGEVVAALVAACDALPDVAIGIGRPVAAIADAHHSLRDAELAAAHADGEPRVVRFEDFDLGTFMVSEIPPERLAPKVAEILSVLHAHPPLHEAIRAYFAHDLDIAATAVSLHMHRNSLRYRLARLEQLLGRSLKQPATIAALYLALAADAAEGVGGMPNPRP
jgi:DNA-binding PucR family transcriptional regulator